MSEATTTTTSTENNENSATSTENSENSNQNVNNVNTAFLDLTLNEAPPLVQVNVIPSCEYVLKGVQNTFHVLFQVKTGSKTENVTRPPCDLAIVLDRSGSMRGEKLNNSKLAIKNIIENLTHNDILHLIAYDTTVDVVFEKGDLTNPTQLFERVDKIRDLNATNLYAGLEKGAEILRKHKVPGAARIQRIFLFSDGLVNTGKRDPEEIKKLVHNLREEGMSISSFGIGSDFDEELMKNISEWGSGDYFFIENAQVIPKWVAKGLRGLLSLIGTEPVLKVRGDNGAIVRKIFAHDAVKGAHLGDLKQNNWRQIVSEIEVAPSKGEGDNLVNWTLTYIPDGEKAQTQIKGSLFIKYTDDDNLIQKKHPAVEVARTMQEIGEVDIEIVALIDGGKKKEAIARLRSNLAKLKEVEVQDSTGAIKVLVETTEKSIKKLEDESVDITEVRKDVHYGGYLKRRNSAFALF